MIFKDFLKLLLFPSLEHRYPLWYERGYWDIRVFQFFELLYFLPRFYRYGLLGSLPRSRDKDEVLRPD